MGLFNYINVEKDIIISDDVLDVGNQPKLLGIRKSDNKRVIIKYNYRYRDPDSGQRSWLKNVDREFNGSKVFCFFGVPCQNVALAIDKRRIKQQRKCIVIENFLDDDEELIEIGYSHYDWGAENVDLKEFIDLYIKKLLDIKFIPASAIEEIIKETIRIIFINALIGNWDFKNNLGVIYNKKNNTFRCAPAYDNGYAFSYEDSDMRTKIFEGLINYYWEYIEDLFLKMVTHGMNKTISSLKTSFFRDVVRQNVKYFLFRYSQHLKKMGDKTSTK